MSKSLGNGPVWENLKDAENERDEMLRAEPMDTVVIQTVLMTEFDFNHLPEFQGY